MPIGSMIDSSPKPSRLGKIIDFLVLVLGTLIAIIKNKKGNFLHFVLAAGLGTLGFLTIVGLWAVGCRPISLGKTLALASAVALIVTFGSYLIIPKDADLEDKK